MKSSARNSLKRLTSLNWSELKKSLLSCSRIARSSVDCLVSFMFSSLLCVVRRSLQVGCRFGASTAGFVRVDLGASSGERAGESRRASSGGLHRFQDGSRASSDGATALPRRSYQQRASPSSRESPPAQERR